MQKIIILKKIEATKVCGTLTSTSKMPCKSYSLPTEACITGFKMAQIEGSICHSCYANKGFYQVYQATIKPAQFSRLDSINDPLWVSGMVTLIGKDEYFRWHDSGDLQSLDHLEKIAQVAELTPSTKHWLPTREYSIVKEYISKHGSIPKNLIIRLSAMYPDKPVTIPKSLQNIPNITASNVHTDKPIGNACNAPKQGGACLDCRLCWGNEVVSYAMH
jgi:hypothetical protein